MTILDFKEIRKNSLRLAHEMGIEVLSSLPMLETKAQTRSVAQITSRILAMHAVSAAAHGFDNKKALIWLERETLIESLTREEFRFLLERTEPFERYHAQIEGMWALAWTLSIVNSLDFAKECEKIFAAMLPNLKRNESSVAFRKKIRLRPLEQIFSACDLAYCLHWAVRQAELIDSSLPRSVDPCIVIERRRALEWSLCDDPWEDISLDT